MGDGIRMAGEKGHSITLTAHGDGSYHTQEHGTEGEYGMVGGHNTGRTEHPTFGHALMHIAAKHGPEGDHMHIHADDAGFTTHHVLEEGKVEGPNEHDSMAQVKRHVEGCMGE